MISYKKPLIYLYKLRPYYIKFKWELLGCYHFGDLINKFRFNSADIHNGLSGKTIKNKYRIDFSDDFYVSLGADLILEEYGRLDTIEISGLIKKCPQSVGETLQSALKKIGRGVKRDLIYSN